ncbi:MAG: hypothetical protein AB8B93_01630 [Pseudomonadales bacterium]
MFDLDTISTAITVAAALGAVLVTVGLLKLILKPKRRRGKRKQLSASLHCSMCQRPTPEGATHEWHIRSVTQHVCERCHPFYKMRFETNRPAPVTAPAAPVVAAPHAASGVSETASVHEDTAAICP